MKKTKIYYLFFIFLIIGCMNDNKDVSVEPNISATSTLESFATPTQTFVEETLPTQTFLPQQISAIETQRAITNKFLSYCDNLYNIKLSPNKKWASIYCYTPNELSLYISSVDVLTLHKISYSELYGTKYESAEGSLWVSHWSQDNNYVYITVFPQMDGGGGFAFFEATALYRLDLNSGKIKETLSVGKSYYSLEISPNDRWLAYFDLFAKPLSLIIHDFQTGNDETIIIASSYNTGGEFAWSENSKLLAFSAATYDDITDEYLVSVLVWDTDKKIFKTIIDRFDMLNALVPVEWIGEAKIVLEERFSTEETRYEFDLKSQTLTLIK